MSKEYFKVEVDADLNKKLAHLLLIYRSNPLAFIRDVIGVTPTQQQIDLILSATKDKARIAVKSATATGKTAALSWLSLYFVICFENVRVLVTAPTSGQLHRVFRSELVYWLNKMNPLFRAFYEVQSKKVFIKGKAESQFIDLVTGTAENKESFAGLHGNKVVIIADEASALPDEIFDTLYGTLSSGSTAFILVSNPVRNSGKFYDLFQVKPENWDLMTFTSYDSPNVDKDWVKETIAYYGEDSDFVKMRINGEFPVVSYAQFFPTELVENAMQRRLNENEYVHYDRVLSLDVARYGDDSSKLIDRQGPKIHSVETYRNLDLNTLSHIVVQKYRSARYTAVYVDGIGIGAGVVDILKSLNLPVVDVIISSTSSDPKMYANLRAQLYAECKSWLSTADLVQDSELKKEMLSIYFGYNKKMQLQIESKKDLKKREGYSPDGVDALTLSFADNAYRLRRINIAARPVIKSNYTWA